jgi:hypothetical protein
MALVALRLAPIVAGVALRLAPIVAGVMLRLAPIVVGVAPGPICGWWRHGDGMVAPGWDGGAILNP